MPTSVVTTAYPDTGNVNLPDLDIEMSLTVPTGGPLFRSIAADARHLQGFTSNRGRSDELNAFTAGKFSATINNRLRWYDPEYTASPLYGHIVPERRIRLLARYNSITYVVFDGYIDEWQQLLPAYNKDAVARVSATDGFKPLAQKILNGSWYETEVAKDLPAHWFKLDEASGVTVAVDSGYATTKYHGTIAAPTMGSTGLITYDASRTSASFDGVDDYVSIPGTATEAATDFSLELWFSSSQTGMSNLAALAAFGGPTLTTDLWRFGFSSGGTVTAYSANNTSVSSISSGYNDGSSHQVAITRSGTTLTLYIDGAVSNTATVEATALNATWFRLGDKTGWGSPSSAYLNGKIQSASFYTRALSTARIGAHYNAGKNAFSGDTTGARVGRILDDISWPTADRDIDTGTTTLGSAALPASSALDYFQTIVATEQGQLYMGLDGAMSSDHTFKLVYRSRHATISAARSITSNATFGTGVGELPYWDLVTENSEARLFNEVKVSSQGNTTQTVSDPTSIENYFARTYAKSGLLYTTDTELLDAAYFQLDRYKDPQYLITGLVLKPQRSATLWPQALGREIGDRITIKVTPAGVGSAISKDLVIQGISHALIDGEWTTTWAVSQIDARDYWVLDTSTLDTQTRLAF